MQQGYGGYTGPWAWVAPVACLLFPVVLFLLLNAYFAIKRAISAKVKKMLAQHRNDAHRSVIT